VEWIAEEGSQIPVIYSSQGYIRQVPGRGVLGQNKGVLLEAAWPSG